MSGTNSIYTSFTLPSFDTPLSCLSDHHG